MVCMFEDVTRRAEMDALQARFFFLNTSQLQ